MTINSAQRAVRCTTLTMRAWLALLAFDAVRPTGFSRLCSWLRRQRCSSRLSGLTPADIVWAVDEACVWYVKRAACLQRSVIATWLLRRHGVRAELVIGCRPIPFESHAWVEVSGSVVNDSPQYQKAFTELDRL